MRITFAMQRPVQRTEELEDRLEVRSFFLRRYLSGQMPYDSPIRGMKVWHARTMLIFKLKNGKTYVNRRRDGAASVWTLYVRLPWWEPFWKRTPRKEGR